MKHLARAVSGLMMIGTFAGTTAMTGWATTLVGGVAPARATTTCQLGNGVQRVLFWRRRKVRTV